MKVDCILVTYNPIKWINQCLCSLRDSTINVKTIIVDNGSTDGSQKIIKTKYPEVDFIQSEENLGFGRANNIGIKKAYDEGADYIFLLNQDAWVDKDTIGELVQIAEKNRNYGIISPIHLNGKGTALDFNFSKYLSPDHCSEIYSDAVLGKVENRLYETNYVNAAAWLISRNCIKKVGGFNPLFFLYGEDDDYMNRVKYHGFKLGIYPLVKIYHDRSERIFGMNNYDDIKKFKMNLIISFCDPSSKKKIENVRISLMKGILKSLFLFRFKVVMYRMKKYRIVESLYKDINQSKKIAKNGDLSFL